MISVVLTIVGVFGISSIVFGQQDELKSATSNIEKKEYIAALDDLNKAKKKVTELMTNQLAEVLPVKFGEFEMASDEMGYEMGGGQGASVNKTYKKPKQQAAAAEGEEGMMEMSVAAELEIRVQVTTNMMMASEVMNAHTISEEGMSGGMDGQKVEAYRVKGYRAIIKTNEGETNPDMGMDQPKMQEAQAIVGGAYIVVTASGMEDGKAKAFLEQIDFEKLVAIVGK